MKKLIIIFICIIILVLGFYYYFANIREQSAPPEEIRASRVVAVLSPNLDIRYPPTPVTVVTAFAEITQVLYNETYSDDDFVALAEQLYRLYDDEIKENNPWDNYIFDLGSDVNSHRRDEYIISSYVVASPTDVIYSTIDGTRYATLTCSFSIRQGMNIFSVEHQFLLRQSESRRWMILGWQRDERF
jgi:hypothetical protein